MYRLPGKQARGEISLSRTQRSPELSFDVTMVELTLVNDQPAVDAFGILEPQTMDFHGSYGAVVKNALCLDTTGFLKALQQNSSGSVMALRDQFTPLVLSPVPEATE